MQIRDRFGTLDLGDHAGAMTIGLASNGGELSRHRHIGRIFREGHSHIVRAQTHRGLDVIHIFRGQRWSRQTTTLLVDTFVVRELATDLYRGEDLVTSDTLNIQYDQAIV